MSFCLRRGREVENEEESLFCEITDVGGVALKSLDFPFLMNPTRPL